MPCRTDLEKILIIGSGPIVIGQACEFDYSGTQGAKALAAEGFEIVLVNSNPATIMTDPELAARTYIEPLDVRTLRRILERERPHAILPTLGGQTALNLALALADAGILDELGVELIGASVPAIRKAEDRLLFKEAVRKIGLECPLSGYASSVDEARVIAEQTGYPLIVRASFTLGGGGSGIVRDASELAAKVSAGLAASPVHQVLVEESVLGWKEFELEVIRDRADNFIVVCSIENIDPMGVHTGDSITVAPAMTLTDREYQRMRDAARAIMSEIGVDTGGSNVQFALDPRTGRMLVIEMNPRVSRSSALASKATGYPIAKIAAKLAVGYTLDELTNDITGTSAAFEPVIDYVVVKWPRFAFEKFPGADARLGTQMKSVGEAMAIGRTFCEALQKAARSLETGRDGLVSLLADTDYPALARHLQGSVTEGAARVVDVSEALRVLIAIPTAERLLHVADAMRVGISDAEIYARSHIDPWFLAHMRRLVDAEKALGLAPAQLKSAKRLGFSDTQISAATGVSAAEVFAQRTAAGVVTTYARVDTCAAELAAETPYLYSSFETASEAAPTDRDKVLVLGGGPNRIGQGIEFDYCCVHASSALREIGIETVMVNCNPETVSTDYDTSDRLYFEPLTLESVLAIHAEESRRGRVLGVIVQFGGQTPLRLATQLAARGVKLLGTGADAIDRAEDRGRFDALLAKLHLKRPRGRTVAGIDDARAFAREVGFPVLVRPSYVLGGRAMRVCTSDLELATYLGLALRASTEAGSGEILVDEFLEGATEVDVDCLADGVRAVIAGVIEHVEEAGVHSGDSAGVLPPHSLPAEVVATIERQTVQIARELGVVGLMNIQFAVRDSEIFVLEVNPRASRTIPFVSKATGVAVAKVAAKVMAGRTLDSLGVGEALRVAHYSVKESVFSFTKLPGADSLLGPEMRSTGEVMGLAASFGAAFRKSQTAAGNALPRGGRVLFSLCADDVPAGLTLARRLRSAGFELHGCAQTARAFVASGVAMAIVGEPTASDGIALVVTTARSEGEVRDGFALRARAITLGIPYVTTLAAAAAAVHAIEEEQLGGGAAHDVRTLQEWHAAPVVARASVVPRPESAIAGAIGA